MYPAVPWAPVVLPEPGHPTVCAMVARPKSASLTRPPGKTSRFSPLMSPCTTPLRCRKASADVSSTATRWKTSVGPGSAAASPKAASRAAPRSGARSDWSEPCSANSSTSQSSPSKALSAVPSSCTTCGCESRSSAASSRESARTPDSSAAGVCLTATSTPCSVARRTTPYAPRPSGRPGLRRTSFASRVGVLGGGARAAAACTRRCCMAPHSPTSSRMSTLTARPKARTLGLGSGVRQRGHVRPPARRNCSSASRSKEWPHGVDTGCSGASSVRGQVGGGCGGVADGAARGAVAGAGMTISLMA
mmetsp:Transcript_23413/g.58438  ORF Transcript_23413/g.58438 Transcript_23413/m.58438 type:complete len:305 (+) Transcript_23413:545-1459(+)